MANALTGVFAILLCLINAATWTFITGQPYMGGAWLLAAVTCVKLQKVVVVMVARPHIEPQHLWGTSLLGRPTCAAGVSAGLGPGMTRPSPEKSNAP
jgi:hypothetical protein